MTFLQIDPTAEGAVDTLIHEAPKQVAEAAQALVKEGDVTAINGVIQQIISFAVEAGKSIILALIIYFVGRFIINLIQKFLIGLMERRNMDATIQSFLRSIVSVLLNVLLIITVVSALGINTTSFAALLASFGVAAGMALSGNLQNLAGGLIILLFKPYRVGDYIEAQGVAGTVKEIQIFHTIILTVDNKQIHVPNGALSSGTVTNYSTMPQRRVDLTVSVEYGQDLDQAREVLMNLINQDERILKDPAPFIGLASMAASSIDFTVRLWVNGADYWGVFFDTQERVYKEFNAKGIAFPYPHLTINKI